VRDQIDFNRAVIRFMDKSLEAEIEQNDNILRVARGLAVLQDDGNAGIGELHDMLSHWKQWRPAWEERLTQSEVSLLHTVREIEAGARDRDASFRAALASTDAAFKDSLRDREASFRAALSDTHAKFETSLVSSADESQKRLWAALEQVRLQQEALIHTELRLIRRRARAGLEGSAQVPPAPVSAAPEKNGTTRMPAEFDYGRFEERFRGPESYVRETLAFYLPYLENREAVLDLGCGRGEMLSLLKEHGIDAEGVDCDPDAVAACQEKGVRVIQADLLSHLSSRPDASLDAILCTHVVEHLEPRQLAELVFLAAAKLKPEGLLAIETPNPGCLAIFAGDFYLDPTHVRPVPSRLLQFLFEEAGLSRIEIEELRPASELIPEVAGLAKTEEGKAFQQRFFGGRDYAILGTKLAV
jgi:O-antigen chain-terminating methyltransferase